MSSSLFGADERPKRSSQDHHYDVQHAINMFEQAVRGDVAWSLSTAFCTLESSAYRKDRRALSLDDRMSLLRAVEQAYRAAWNRLQDFPRAKIVSGFRAAAAQVDHWHRPSDANDKSAGDGPRDARALARIFRNEMHNLCLLKEIQERADARNLFADEPTVFGDPPAVAFIDAA